MITALTEVHDGYRQFRFSGTADDLSLVQAVRKLWQEPGYHPDRPEIYDFRFLDSTLVSLHGLAALQRMNVEMHADAPLQRVAVLVGATHQYALAQAGIPYSRSRGAAMAVFHSESEAVAWVTGAD